MSQINSIQSTIRLCGRVFSGIGIGGKYVELYRGLFKKILGVDPYPGTLNIDFGFDTRDVLLIDNATTIPPPSIGLSYLYVFKAILNDRVEVFVLKPLKTRYLWNVLEVISEFNLRRKLGLRDNDFVELVFMV